MHRVLTWTDKIPRRVPIAICMVLLGLAIQANPYWLWDGDIANWNMAAARIYGLVFVVFGVGLAAFGRSLPGFTLFLAPVYAHALLVGVKFLFFRFDQLGGTGAMYLILAWTLWVISRGHVHGRNRT